MYLCPLICLHDLMPLSSGFLPILFTWLRMGRQTSPTHLSLKPDPQPNSASQQLRGRKVLILWLPAACDLMSATVRVIHQKC